jgi:5-methylthioribose kinase
MAYETLTEKTAGEYARAKANIFSKNSELECKEIGDGNLNLVFRVKEKTPGGKSVIIKQSMPHARIDKSIIAPLERADIESEMLVLYNQITPNLSPKIYFYDKEEYAIIMEDLSAYIVLRKGLIRGNLYPHLAEHMGEFLARSLFFTSDLGLDPLKKKAMQKKFINPDLCKITEDLVFSNPYFDASNNKIDPEIRTRAERNWVDDELKSAVAVLKEKFMTQGQALIHGDLHTGSVFVTADSTKIFDPEFAFFGPMGFDIGAILGNVILNYLSQEWHLKNSDNKKAYQRYLLDTFRGIWMIFSHRFRELWNSSVTTPMESNPVYRENYMKRLFSDSIGYAGCKMARRIVGLAQVEDIRSIPDAEVRAKVQIAALDISREFIIQRDKYYSIEDVVGTVQNYPL